MSRFLEISGTHNPILTANFENNFEYTFASDRKYFSWFVKAWSNMSALWWRKKLTNWFLTVCGTCNLFRLKVSLWGAGKGYVFHEKFRKAVFPCASRMSFFIAAFRSCGQSLRVVKERQMQISWYEYLEPVFCATFISYNMHKGLVYS